MYMWHNTPWMWLSMTLFWGLLAVGVFYLLKGPHGPSLPRRAGAAEILEERYARGEISAEEYRERVTTLEATRPAPGT